MSEPENAVAPADRAGMGTEARKRVEGDSGASWCESGHILDETQVRIIRKNAEVVRRSPERADSYTDLVLHQLDSLADSHAALTARLAAVERERDAALETVRMALLWDTDACAFDQRYGLTTRQYVHHLRATLGQEPTDGR